MSDIPDTMIMTWATLELVSDSLALLHQHHEASSLRSTTPSTGSNKRQRIEEPVAEMLNVMTSARHAENRLFALQTMYFFVMRHWDQLHGRLQTTIKNTIQNLMVDPAPEVQQWADLNLGAICHLVFVNTTQEPSSVIGDQPNRQIATRGNGDWLKIWQLALRKLVITAAASSRTAALLLQVIVRKQVIEPALFITSIGKFLEGVSDQGPAAPYDTVCDFMVICLDAADQDARLHRMGFTSKFSSLRDDRPLTLTPLLVGMQKEEQILDIRNFMLHAKLPALPQTEKHSGAFGQMTAAPTDTTARPFSASEARALSRLFGLKLQQLSLTDVDGSNVARLRGKLDGCILILLAESSFIDSDPEHSQANFDAASDLLEKVLQLILQKSWTLGERAKLFVGLNVLFPHTRSALLHQDQQAESLVCLPGYASGILSVITGGTPARERDRLQEVGDTEVSLIHVRMWQKPKLCDIFRSRVREFYQVLQGDDLHLNGNASNIDAEDADDDFAIKTDDDTGTSSMQNDSRVVEAIVTGSIRCCLLPQYCANGMSTHVKDRNILNMLINTEPSAFLRLCYPIFLGVRNGLLAFNDEAASSIYQELQDYLLSYTCSLSSAMRQAAANFVNTILSRLSPLHPESFHSGAGELVSFFLNWLGANLTQGKLIFWEERLAVIRLFARLMELDPQNEAWSNQKQDDTSEDFDDPVLLLCKLVDDTDARVRFRLGVIVARLFQWLPDQDFNALYRDVVADFHTSGFQVENIFSILVFQLNVTIVNAIGRFNSLFHIYDTAYARTFARHHIQVSLQYIVRALRLSGISELYLQYAARLATPQLAQDGNSEDLPMQLYGFSTRKEWASAALTAVGSAALLKGKTWVWEHLSATVGLNKEEGLQHIFSATVGKYLALEFSNMMPERSSDKDWTAMSQFLRDFEVTYAALGGKGQLELNPIDIISSVICMPGDEDGTEDLAILLQSQDDGIERSRVFTEIYSTGGTARELEEVLVPVTSTLSCIRVIQWIERKNKQMELDTIVYNVLMQTVGRLDTKILINERTRLIRKLALFVAYYHRAFLNNAVLGFVLLRTGAVLAQHHDLAPISANLISWILPRMKFVKGADGDLVAILARLSAVAMSYIKAPDSQGIPGWRDAGGRILTTLEAFLDLLWRNAPPNIRAIAFMPLLPIWPRALPKTPNKRMHDMSLAELLEKAQDPAIHKQVFSLTRQLASKSDVPRDSEIDIFSSRVFWQLKDALSGAVAPSAEDMSAFFEFCYSNGGRIRMIDPDTYASLRPRTPRSRNRLYNGRSDPTHFTSDILFAIFDRLHSADLGSQHRAYHTLCIVGSAMSALAQQAVGLTSLVQLEMGLLHARAPSENVDDAVFMEFIGSESPAGINLALPLETERWMTMFASATCMHQVPLATKTVIIEILLYLRRQGRPRSPNHLSNDRWLKINFSVVAKAALDCKMYATALLYWELHVDPDNKSAPKAFGEDAYQLLYDIYNNIDEPDGFYGIPLESNAKNAVLQRFQHESNRSLAFKYYGAESEANGNTARHLPQLTRSLQAFGKDRLDSMLFQAEDTAELSRHYLPYDLAWRTQSWDLPSSAFLPESSDRSIYTALRTIHRPRDLEEMQQAVEGIEREELESVRAFSLEDVHGLRKKTQELLSLREIKRWTQEYLPKVGSAQPGDHEYQRFLDVPPCIEPEMTEQILSVRLSLIRSARSQDEWQSGDMKANRGKVLLQLERQCLQHLGSLARRTGDLDGAIKILAEQQSLSPSGPADHVIESADILWLQGDHGLAIDRLKTALSIDGSSKTDGKEGTKTKLVPVKESELLSRVGQWMAEVKYAHPEIIYHENFKPAKRLLAGPATDLPGEEHALVYSRFADFSHREYCRLAQMSASQREYEVQRRFSHDALKPSPATGESAGEPLPTALYMGPHRELPDGAGEREISQAFDYILRQVCKRAIKCYATVLCLSDKYDHLVHAMCALWLQSASDPDLNDAIGKSLRAVPSHKFAALVTQLAAHLDERDDNPDFQDVLRDVLEKLCADHPFHAMYGIITLTKGVNSGRQQAAQEVLKKVQAQAHRTLQIQKMELFAKVSIAWCRLKVNDNVANRFDVPWGVLADLADLHIPIPTQDLPFDFSSAYKPSPESKIAYINRYERTYKLADGKSKPKIMECVAEDGRRFRQLFKRNDDLRQDSVIEQFFSLANTLLQRDEATAKRELRVKTYVVLPLDRSTGIIDLRPGDLSSQRFRDDMEAIQSRDSNAHAELKKKFQQNMKTFKPVMRHFFTEMSNDPVSWYAMRLKYARSVAVGSIAGHLVGLGDRHCSNIMVNDKTGEILHVDLGIAFDQGEDSNIPERVPFRLTANIIDGLGSFGVEGVFKRCCEQTSRVLREKADLILTVLEVVKHDPLHRWYEPDALLLFYRLISPFKHRIPDFDQISQSQGEAVASASGERMAQVLGLATIALNGVRAKLSNAMPVEQVVDELTRNATDPANLALMYYGWQPWL
ncbi:hypothetical protein QFC20_007506 [Naganishia adeliensis]|uniref:Uncharacterized protein n=1 Tax=Naganishia adeliensis TaxID=92952 RepID=A0ACC2UYJ5_9TREE|nr:hypothetical protein QFC20_007506 [Naganishia adeliensis]